VVPEEVKECCILNCLFFFPTLLVSHADAKKNDYREAMFQEECLRLLLEKFDGSGNFDDWVNNYR